MCALRKVIALENREKPHVVLLSTDSKKVSMESKYT